MPTVGELKAKYYKSNPNGHFFDKATIRFFSSKIEAVFKNDYFITSERLGFDDYRKGFTIRKLSDDANPENISEFNEYSSLQEARQAFKIYKKENKQ